MTNYAVTRHITDAGTISEALADTETYIETVADTKTILHIDLYQTGGGWRGVVLHIT